MLSNLIINTKEQQYSNKEGGAVSLCFENDKPCSELINEETFQLCYISKKQGEFDTHKVETTNNITFALLEEIEGEMRRLHPDKTDLTLLKVSYYYAELLLEKQNCFSESNPIIKWSYVISNSTSILSFLPMRFS